MYMKKSDKILQKKKKRTASESFDPTPLLMYDELARRVGDHLLRGPERWMSD